ncbi:MAG TPA: hypothetical protein VFW94_15105 [Candidatus Acidoferrales bacterium]|nr:hypothetical protein [Candidatus Acidoferrales bacterium]
MYGLVEAELQPVDRLGIGGNRPPGPLDYGLTAIEDLSRFLADNPVIETDEQARQAKTYVDRMRSTLGDIEAERIKLTKPLNDELASINERFKSHHNTDAKKPGIFDKVFNELKKRIADFARKQEAEKARIAEEARRKALEAERIAREAEAKEREAIDNAKAGELGVDVTQVVVEADSRFADYQKAQREADRAEREVTERIGGGFSGRALSLRTKETLVLDSYNDAIKAIGPNEKIETAILSAARDYRKLHGKLPAGVRAETERTI